MSARRALIAATGVYQDDKLRELRAPAADAERLAGVLRDPEIGSFDVDVALDESEGVLRRRIARFFATCGREDVLLLHVSGHGVKDAQGGLYLAAADTEMDLLDATAISAAWLGDQISRSPSRRKLLLLDCCFSGKFPFNTTARAGDSVDVQERFQGRGRAVITASNSMEYAYEGDELSGEGQPSYFTAALVDALATGEADRDQDELISVDELYAYIYDRVKDVSPNQTPTKQIELEGPLYVARSHFKVPVKPATLDEQLVLLTEHPFPGTRLGAIDELIRLMTSASASVALAARHALERMVDDDSRRVAERATKALGEQERREAPAQARLEAEMRAQQKSQEQAGQQVQGQQADHEAQEHLSPATRLVADWNSGAQKVIQLEHPKHGLVGSGSREINGIAFNHDGKMIVTASGDKTARVWEVDSGRELIRFQHAGRVAGVAFSPDGRLIATASHDKTARVWEVDSGRVQISVKHARRVPASSLGGPQVQVAALSGVAFSPDGTLIATAGNDYTARVWEVDSGRELIRFQHAGPVAGVAFSPDGRLIATASHDKTARVWEVEKGRERHCLQHGARVAGVAFSPESKLIATAGQDATVRLWDVSTGDESACIEHIDRIARTRGMSGNYPTIVRDWVLNVAFSPDGTSIATAGADKTARMWELDSMRELLRFEHAGRVAGVAFSAQGNLIATGSHDRTARVWKAYTREPP